MKSPGVSSVAPASAQESVELRWKPPEKGVLAYSMWQAPEESGPTLAIDALADGGAPDAATLVAPAKLDAAKLAMIVQRHRARMNVQMIALEDLTPEGMKEKPPIKQLAAGSVQDVCELELDGRVASFWKPQRTRNIFAMLFQMPRTPVKIGDTWSIDVGLLEIGLGPMLPSREARTNRVKLVALRKDRDDTVATLEYVLAESLVADGAGAKPGSNFHMRMAFVGRGEFLVNKGAWRSLVGRMAIESDEVPSQRVFMGLRPMSPVPASVLKAAMPLK